MILKTLKSITEDQELEILPLWKEDEYEFTRNLFRKAVLQKKKMMLYYKLIPRIGKKKD